MTLVGHDPTNSALRGRQLYQFVHRAILVKHILHWASLTHSPYLSQPSAMFDFIGTSHTQLYGLPTTQLSALYSILLSSTNFVLDLISIILLFAYVSLVLFSLLWVSNLVPDALPGFITENPNRRPGCGIRTRTYISQFMRLLRNLFLYSAIYNSISWRDYLM